MKIKDIKVHNITMSPFWKPGNFKKIYLDPVIDKRIIPNPNGRIHLYHYYDDEGNHLYLNKHCLVHNPLGPANVYIDGDIIGEHYFLDGFCLSLTDWRIKARNIKLGGSNEHTKYR